MTKFILIILDGFGLREESNGNAYKLANTPELDRLLNICSMVPIETSGKFVGLPDGIMGNSEVGHMNLGAGRIVKQDLVRINDDIKSNKLKDNPKLIQLFSRIKKHNSTLHLAGLLSDGGVHSHINHLIYVLKSAKAFGLTKVHIHAFMDGRDTAPDCGENYINEIEAEINQLGIGKITTVCGRYYAMDRDNRWDRIKLAYNMLIKGKGEKFDTAKNALEYSYQSHIYDEFITPKILNGYTPIAENDGVFMFNYRADRMRQICDVFTNPNFNEFKVASHKFMLVGMNRYKESFTFPVLYKKEKLTRILPEILEENGISQLRIAETEKYAHVTYFFNGGNEHLFPNEDRILVNSPKVATYDLQPEMSAKEVTTKVLDAINSKIYGGIILNFANPDMVGHTGVLPAGVQAIETIDDCLSQIIKSIKKQDGVVFLTADHGNLEMMIDPITQKPHTAHTTLPVPFIIDDPTDTWELTKSGKLADVAPSILAYLHIEKPIEMTGESLLSRKVKKSFAS
jgi:2,3-bisphosphoglycerate-independent phosphoglycerate mutase